MSVEDRVKHQVVLKNLFARHLNEDKNGYTFYQYFFRELPDFRKYFKGAETITPEKVGESERFHKQGLRILLSMHICVNLLHDKDALRAYAREMVIKHKPFKGINDNNDLYKAFWGVYAGFLEEHLGGISAEEKASFMWMGERFAEASEEFVGPKAKTT